MPDGTAAGALPAIATAAKNSRLQAPVMVQLRRLRFERKLHAAAIRLFMTSP